MSTIQYKYYGNSKITKQMKKIFIIVMICLSICSMPVYSSSLATVPISSPVYPLLESIYIKMGSEGITAVKPYTQSYIIEQLQKAVQHRELFSDAERTIIEKQLEKLKPDDISLFKDGAIQTLDTDSGLYNRIGAALFSRLQADPLLINSSESIDSRNGIECYLTGGIDDLLTYRMSATIRYDVLDSQAWILPQDFFWPNEGFYMSYKGSGDGTNVVYGDGIGMGYNTYPEATLSLMDNRLQFRWGMFPRQWGFGDGSLVLSETAKPFDAIEAAFQFTNWISYAFITGTLTDWHSPGEDSFSNDNNFQNMFTTKRVELKPLSGLRLSLFETCVWIKRFELGYLNPFMITTLYQNILGDWDNMFAGAEFEWLTPAATRLYGTFMVDEMNSTNPLYWFKQARNMFALQAGIETSPAYIGLSTLGLQYTRIEPFFYTHYMVSYPSYDTAMNTCYQNKDVNLGYYLAPNSDELLLSFKTSQIPDYFGEIKLRYLRHSGQYGDDIQENIIYAVIDHPNYYSYTYGEKDFINTLIEQRFIGELYLEHAFEHTPIQVFVNYGVSFWREREVTEWYTSEYTGSSIIIYPEIEAKSFGPWSGIQAKQVITLGVKLYY